MAAPSATRSVHFRNTLTLIRSFSSQPTSDPQFDFFSNAVKPDGNNNNSSVESSDDFEKRLFGSLSSRDSGSVSGSFYRRLDRIDKVRAGNAYGFGSGGGGYGSSSGMGGVGGGGSGDGDSFDSLADGMDEKLKAAATTVFPTSDEIYNEDYAFRPDVNFEPGMTYTPKDLDLTKPGIQKNVRRPEFETTTAEVLKKADFRNVRFLANFLTEAGIIIKRSQTKISAKAQRKVAREIKTARAFGLMPFTTMGTKKFNFGRSSQDKDEDYEYDAYFDRTITGAAAEPEEMS